MVFLYVSLYHIFSIHLSADGCRRSPQLGVHWMITWANSYVKGKKLICIHSPYDFLMRRHPDTREGGRSSLVTWLSGVMGMGSKRLAGAKLDHPSRERKRGSGVQGTGS